MSAAGDAAQDLITSYNNKISKVAPGAVGIQLGLMAALGVAALCAFSILRPKNSVVYQPKVKYAADEKRPPKIGKGLWDWIAPVWKTKEDELMATIGLDAVAYLRFLRMCRNIFLAVAILCCAILLPINLVYNLRNVDSQDRNYLIALTMSKVKGNWLWAHVVATYVLTGIVFFFLWTNWRAIVRLRWQWFRSPAYQDMLHARSLLITQVKKQYQTDEGLAQLLTSLNIPYPTSAVHIGRRVGALPALIEKHNEAVKELEEVLTRYFKNPDRLPTNRPTKRIGGWLGMGGHKVDSIDYLTQKITQLDQRVHLARSQINERKAENYGFASFESVPFAHIVAKKLRGKRRHNAHFDLAPQPNDIQWSNLTLSDAARTKNKFFGGILLVLLCGFYTIPLVAVALLANLSALSAYVDFIDKWVSDYPTLFSAFVGIVPPVLTLVLQMILPMIIRWISGLQGATTHSQADRLLLARLSAFLFITQFIIFSLLGVVVQIISTVVIDLTGEKKSTDEVLDYLATIPDKLQNTYMIQSNYWLTVFPLRGASCLFDLAQIVSLLLVWFRTRMFGRTPREIREWTKPPIFDFPVYLSNHLLIVAVALVYAPIAPLVALFGAGVFAVSSWVYKYQLMYVSVTRSETGGRLWNVACNRILMALLLMHIFMAVSIGLQSEWFYAIALAPPFVSVMIFKIILDRKFDDRFRWYIPSETEMAEVHMHHADARKNRLQKRFGHDALSEPLYTPMLHKSVQHLLPTIYSGRIGQTQGKVEGVSGKVEQNTAGGLTFALMEAHDLEVDRNAWLRHRAEDEMTVTTSADLAGRRTPGPGSVAGDDYFNARRAEYLKHGADMSRSNTSFIPSTPDEELLPLELQRMPTYQDGSDAVFNRVGTPNESTENLIQPVYPPQYSSPPSMRGSPAMGHRPNFSQTSLGSFASGGGYSGDIGTGGHPLEMAQHGVSGGPRAPSRQSNNNAGTMYAPLRGGPVHGHSSSQDSQQWRPQHYPNQSMQSQASSQEYGSPRRMASPPQSQPMSRPGSRNQHHPAYPPISSAGAYATAAAAYDRGMARTPPAEEALATPMQARIGLGVSSPYAPLNPDGSTENLPGALDPQRQQQGRR
ncbi:hypothetical protein JCM10213_006753 [Rhodosporidiobolus nylandii]